MSTFTVDEAPPLDFSAASESDAPWGYRADGTPKARPGRKPKGETDSTPVPRSQPVRAATGTRKAITATSQSVSNEDLAHAAAKVLASTNGVLAFFAGMGGLENTSDAIRNAKDEFIIAATDALLMDPGLCRQILSGGATTGKGMLLLAYGSLIMAVAPTALAEFKMKRAESEEG